jgi:hypothetical protein
MTLKEDALGDTGVNNTWLNNVEGIVFEIVEDDTLADSVVLVGVFNDWFLEVTFEFEYLL